MEEKIKRKRIQVRTLEGHHAKPEDWARARPVPLEGHRCSPNDPLILVIPGSPKRRVELRADDQGNLFLELKD